MSHLLFSASAPVPKERFAPAEGRKGLLVCIYKNIQFWCASFYQHHFTWFTGQKTWHVAQCMTKEWLKSLLCTEGKPQKDSPEHQAKKHSHSTDPASEKMQGWIARQQRWRHLAIIQQLLQSPGCFSYEVWDGNTGKGGEEPSAVEESLILCDCGHFKETKWREGLHTLSAYIRIHLRRKDVPALLGLIHSVSMTTGAAGHRLEI